MVADMRTQQPGRASPSMVRGLKKSLVALAACSLLGEPTFSRDERRHPCAPRTRCRISSRRRWCMRLACVTVLGLLPLAPPVMGCTCGPKPSTTEGLARAEAVFVGRVVELWPILVSFNGEQVVAQRYRLQIQEKWKGPIGPEVFLVDGLCTQVLKQGEPYLVYAKRHPWAPWAWSTSVCDLTRQGEELSDEEQRELGRSEVVQSAAGYQREWAGHLAGRRVRLASLAAWSLGSHQWRSLADSGRRVWVLLGLGLCGLALVVGLAWLGWRRQWRTLVLCLVVLTLLVPASVLWWGYSWVADHPLSSHLVD